jgi:hypothetical protein
LPVGSFVVALDFFFAFFAAGLVRFVFCPPVDDGFSPRLDPLGAGVVLVDEVDVVDELPLPLEDDDPEAEVELEGEVVVELEELLDEGDDVVVVLVVVALTDGAPAAGAATQESVSDPIPVRVTGSGICETGVPGGTLSTLNVYDWPVRSVTVTVQVSADADDSAPNDNAIRLALTIRSTANSFRRLITAALLLGPSSRCALQWNYEQRPATSALTLLTPLALCNLEPRPAAI